MFKMGLPLIKEGAHADDRLSERTNLDNSVLTSLRKDVKKAPIPYGTQHVELEDGSFAVLKDVSSGGKKRHVVATVLAPHMTPPGVNIARSMAQKSDNKDVYVGDMSGPKLSQQSGAQDIRSKGARSGKYGMSRRERIKDRLMSTQEKGGYRHKKIPGGYQSSQSYSYSSSDKVASVNRKKKNASARHTLVTGHSGAGKSTLSKRLAEQTGLPIYELDKDPDIVEQLERQKAYIKSQGGLDRGAAAKLPTGPEWDVPFQRASNAGINRALALKTPHIIEGTYLLDRDPKSLRAHKLHLVDTPEESVLNRRVERQRVKDVARGRYWGDDRATGVRLRGQQLIDENKQGATRWRESSYVKKASVMGAAAGAYSAGGNKKNRAKGAVGGAVGGQVLGWAGTGAGLYGAHKLGYTKDILKNRSAIGATRHIMMHPIQATKSLGLRGTALIGTASVGATLAGGYLGGKYLTKPKGGNR